MAEPTPTEDEAHAELIAFLDGEMDEQAAAQFEQRLQHDSNLRLEAEALKRTWDLLDFLPQPEPSSTFTSQTLAKVSLALPVPSSLASMPAALAHETDAPTRARTNRRLAIGGWSALALAMLVLGYVLSGPILRKPVAPADPQAPDEEIVRDLRVLHLLPQYELGEDLAFLQALDHPDLFGAENTGR